MRRLFLSGIVALLAAAPARADDSFAAVAEAVNKKVVKLYGSGGVRGLASYGTGALVSADGYILTAASHLLDTQDLRVHLYDGSRYHAKVVAVEPELDVALVKIDAGREKLDDLPHFDVAAAARRPVAEPGTHVLAFSNQFQIATRDEPVSIQRGVVAAYARLYGRSGIFEAPYKGMVYVLDAITNNPGAAGGVLTTRKGELLGLLGKELRNELTNTWINYAVPIGAAVEVRQPEGLALTVRIPDLVEKKEQYKPIDPSKRAQDGGGGYHGLVLVPNVVDRTPPYVEEVLPGSPAAKAGLKPDDLIVYVDGLPVVSIEGFHETLARYRPGDELKLEVRRGDKLTTLTLKLDPPLKPAVKRAPRDDAKDKDK
jgi:serine protease Do